MDKRTELIQALPKNTAIYYVNSFGEKIPGIVIGYTHASTPRVRLYINDLTGDRNITVNPSNVVTQG